MNQHPTTKITHISWGKMEVTTNEQTQTFKDCKVWPGGARAWDWNETGTHHRPGIQPADIQEILMQGVDVLILSRGMTLRLGTSPETKGLLRDKKIDFHILETKRAVDKFNQMSKEGIRVGGIFHSTC